MNVGTFGDIIFTVSAYRLYLIDGVSRKSGARIEEHQVTGGKPRAEFIAPALTEISFTITLLAGHGVGPVAEAERLRGICERGEVHRLMIGGRNLGKFLLTEVSDDWEKSMGDGRVTVAKVKVSFKEYL